MDRARDILKNTFGYHDFRHHQEAVIAALLGGRDVLALMPTGGGKSLCYQIPALLRAGTGIVVSPLIALMQDQVEAVRQLGIRAAFLNSSLDASRQHQTEVALRDGQLDLLYVAPERLLRARMLNLLDQIPIALFAIDEAHCVAQWGHDFRKDYQQLSVLPQRYPQVPRIALTATADLRTRAEILAQLRLENAAVFIDSFDRPNIFYAVNAGTPIRERLWQFLEKTHPRDAGIVYCLSRQKVADVALWLQARGRQALPYHAGLPDETRRQHQQRFLRESGLIMVATIAFGMGIDKPDVRFVAHLSLPKTIESYYQETGRAGRDGGPASAWMAYSLQDVITLRRFVQQTDSDLSFKRIALQKLEAMLSLCELTGCRRQALLAYFGETLAAPCGHCDNCTQPPRTWDGTVAAQKALSCAHRTGQRFGANYLIDVLTGQDDARIRRNGHDRLSVFARGTEHSTREWRSIFRQLIVQGYLAVDDHGALGLTNTCRPLLRGEQTLPLRAPAVPARIRHAPDPRDGAGARPDDEALFAALRALRLTLARDQGVPPYVIFHDATLQEMVRARPTTREQLRKISGVGEHKLKRYGPQFIATISQFAIG